MADALKLDSTLIIIFTLIFVLYFLLKKVFFGRVEKIIEKREQVEREGREKIDSLQSELEIKNREIEDSFNTARKETMKMQAELIKTANQSKEELINRTRIESKKIMQNKMGELEKKIKAAENKLCSEIDELSDKIKEKML